MTTKTTKTMRGLAAAAAVSAAVLAGCGTDPVNGAPNAADVPGASDDRIQSDDYQGIRWEPLLRYVNGRRAEAYLRFHDDGTWSGSDGCNGQSGRYTLSPGGHLTAKPGPQTLIWCPGVAINAALQASDRMDVENGQLVLYDGDQIVMVFDAVPVST